MLTGADQSVEASGPRHRDAESSNIYGRSHDTSVPTASPVVLMSAAQAAEQVAQTHSSVALIAVELRSILAEQAAFLRAELLACLDGRSSLSSQNWRCCENGTKRPLRFLPMQPLSCRRPCVPMTPSSCGLRSLSTLPLSSVHVFLGVDEAAARTACLEIDQESA